MKDNFNVENKVADLLNPTLKAMGYRLVRVRMAGSQNKTMQVMAERVDEVNMTVEDCALISREVSNILDAANPVEDAYSLEISSPGIDRPLVCPSDYDHYAYPIPLPRSLCQYPNQLIARLALHFGLAAQWQG